MEIAVLDRTPYRMLGLGTYLVAVSGFVYYYLQFVAVLSRQYNILLEVSGTGGFQKWTHNQEHVTTTPRARVLFFSFNLHVERSPLA